jgi:poly(hydroxyalkanoate) granule-associated protein
MVKKLKKLAGGEKDNQLAMTVRESAQQIWLAGLGAFSKAQEEGGKVFEALVKEGESIQSRTRKAAEDKVMEVAGKATGTWDKLEQVFEDRVARALGKLGVPSKKEIDSLSERVAELTEAVNKISAPAAAVAPKKEAAPRKPAPRKPAKPAAAPAEPAAPAAPIGE